MKRILAIITAVALAGMQLSNAQDTRLSQPFSNVLHLNPAMMSLSNDLRINLNYRNQWASIDKGYSTYGLSLMCPLFLNSKSKGGDTTANDPGKSRLDFGLNVVNDNSFGFNRVNITFNLGYSLKVNASNTISAALNVGYMLHTFNSLNQTFDEQFVNGGFSDANPTGEDFDVFNKGNFDVGMGFVYRFAPVNGKIQAFAGVSGFHLNQPNLSFTGGTAKFPARYHFQAGVKIIGSKMDFTPVFLYNLQGRFKQLSIGLLAAYKFDKKGQLVIGAWYKENDAIVLQAGYEYKFINFAYSYDFGISKLARTTPGLMTHEASLGFRLLDMGAKKGIKAANFF